MDDASDGGGGHHFDRTGALTLRRSPGFITLERAIEFRMSHGNAAIVGRELISAALLAASEARS